LQNPRSLAFSFTRTAVAVGGFLVLALFSAYHKDASPVTLSLELQATPKYVGYMDFYKPVELCFSITTHHPPAQFYKAVSHINLLKPNDIYIYIYIYICRTAALTSRRYILNIYSTNIHTEYFKHAA